MLVSQTGKIIPLRKCRPITYCKFCKAEGRRVRCTVMTKYKPPYDSRDWYKHYACDDHIQKIEDPDPHGVYDMRTEVPQTSASHDSQTNPYEDHYTEADYQTWMRL